jgi:hypothetical protein
MSPKPSLHLNTEDLVAIFIRYSTLLQILYTLPIFLATLGDAGWAFSNDSAIGKDVPHWSIYFDLGKGLVQFLLYPILFIKARGVARFIVGESKAISFEGSPQSWIATILQLMGISLIVLGLASSSGLLVTDYIRMQQMGVLYESDSAYMRALVEMIVRVAAGLFLIFKSSFLARWLNSKR